jgi:hypothetical protein
MKSTRLITFLILLSHPIFANDITIDFEQSRFKISDSYKELTGDELDLFKSTTYNHPKMRIFERNNSETDFQRLMISYDSITDINHLSFKEIVKLKLDILKKYGADFKEEKRDSLLYFLYGTLTLKGKQSLFGFSVNNYGIMNVQFNDENNIEEFEKILQSIQYDNPFKHPIQQKDRVKKERDRMSKSGWGLMIASIMMFLVWGFRKLIQDK